MFGSHLSIAGGLHHALLGAEKHGMETVQVFTANPRTFGPPPPTNGRSSLPDDVIAQWRSHHDRLQFRRTVSHDSYLINLASPDEAARRKSVGLFAAEMARCLALGIPYLVTHPGAHLGQGEEIGLRRVAESLDAVHDLLPSPGPPGVVTCLEITAGQGSSLGWRLEHLAEIIGQVRHPQRVGVCLDTAHLFAAGYDFRGRKYTKFRKELDATVGVDRVKVLHLNDSKKELGSRVDRHDHIGLGKIGPAGFKPFVRDEAFADVPKILETPKGKDDQGRAWDEVNLEVLRGMMK